MEENEPNKMSQDSSNQTSTNATYRSSLYSRQKQQLNHSTNPTTERQTISLPKRIFLGTVILILLATAVIVPFVYISLKGITKTTQTITTSVTTSTTTTSTRSTTTSTSSTTTTSAIWAISSIASANASNFWSGAGSPQSQLDGILERPGNSGSAYNSGGLAPQNIDLEFPGEYNISSICLQCAQLPNGVTWHQLQAGPNMSSLSVIANLSGFTSSGQWLNTSFSPPVTGVRFLRLITLSSPSWIAWLKFLVYRA